MAAPRTSFDHYYPLNAEACGKLTTSTRFVLAALLEHTDSDAADLIRNTPRIDPVAPVQADFVGAGGPAALAEATEAWKAFQKANRILHSFLVLCVAQGKDRDI